MALSRKQDVFLNEYLRTWNATEAARRAGYAVPKQEGARLLQQEVIASEIAQRLAEKVMGADEVLARLAEQSRAEYADYISDVGTVDLAAMKRDGKMHLIKSVKSGKYGLEITFYDAQTALISIGRHHQLFTDKVDVSGGLELKENESAIERVASRLDSILARTRAAHGVAGTGTNGSGTTGA